MLRPMKVDHCQGTSDVRTQGPAVHVLAASSKRAVPSLGGCFTPARPFEALWKKPFAALAGWERHGPNERHGTSTPKTCLAKAYP